MANGRDHDRFSRLVYPPGATAMHLRKQQFVETFVFAIAVYLPCRYLWPLDATYFVDWRNHEWAIGYFGEYLRANHEFPAAFNTPQIAGVPSPVFYGSLFYPLSGFFSAFLTPGLVIRFGAIVLFSTQYLLIQRALRVLSMPPAIRWSAGCMVVWAIYPLTNLYNRGALTEFFATGLLTCALLCVVLVFLSEDQRASRRFASGAMFCLTLSAGTHPITALYGVPVLTVLGILLFLALGGNQARRLYKLKILLPWSVPALVCLLPWYLAVHQYASHLRIQSAAVTFFGDSIDSALTRFFPVAWDRRVVDAKAFDPALTPYLDAQINVSLLVFSVALFVLVLIHRRQVAKLRRVVQASIAIGFGLFGVFTWLSLSPTPYEYLPATATMIQFAYRIVTYQNLILLTLVILLLGFLARGGTLTLVRRNGSIVAVVCALAAATGVVVKWSHVAAVKQHFGSAGVHLRARERRALVDLPPTYYGWSDYSTTDMFPPFSAEVESHLTNVNIRVHSDKHFGKTDTTQVTFDHETWVHSNVLAFPWNRISVDGIPLDEASLRVLDDRLVIRIPPGAHSLRSRFRPPTWWRLLRVISMLATTFWLLSLLVPARTIYRLWTTRRKASTTPTGAS